jgi:hypothetical protein
LGFASVTTAVSLKDLGALIAAGDGVNNRTGQAIRCLSLRVSATLVGGQSNVVTDDNRNTFRFLVLQGSAGTNPAGITVNSIIDPRFTTGVESVLFDKQWTLCSPGPDSTGYMPAAVGFRRNISLRGQVLKFSNVGAGTQKGENLWILCVSDSAAVTNPGFTADSTFALEFEDV